MTTRTWRFELDGRPHTVVLEHGAFSGKRTLSVDGHALAQTETFRHLVFDTGSRHPFSIGAHSCMASVRLWALGFLGFRYALTVDGHPVAPEPIRPRPGGCLIAWLSLVALANAGSVLSYLVLLSTGGALGLAAPPWMGALLAGLALLSLAYLALALAALRWTRWSVVGLYILSLLTIPLNVTYVLGTLGPLAAQPLLPALPAIAVAVGLAILAWLLGLLGIFVLATLLQESGYLTE